MLILQLYTCINTIYHNNNIVIIKSVTRSNDRHVVPTAQNY